MKMLESRVRINENGRIVVPASFRRELSIRPGETLHLRLEENELRISTLRQRLMKAQKAVQARIKPSVSLVDELIAERREAARRE
jgi:AbrB family looped-hinge helix DNA binding protein